METNINFCEKCQKNTENEIINIQEGDDCWKVITVKCTKCGQVKEVKIYN